MARLPRLYIPGLPQLFQLQAAAHPIARDEADLVMLLTHLKVALQQHGCALYAYGVSARYVRGLVLPPDSLALGRALQSLGRRYVAYYNRRYVHGGSLWAGRYRSAALIADEYLMDVMRYVEGTAQTTPWSSAPHHLGLKADPHLADPTEYWQLGNEPFERQARYHDLLQEPLPERRVAAIEAALRGGWLLGSDEARDALSELASRRLAPGRRGRPIKTVPIK